MKKTKEKNGAISSILLIVISAIILLIAIVFFVAVQNKIENNNSNDNQKSASVNDSSKNSKDDVDDDSKNEDDKNESKIPMDDLIKLVGTYETENDITMEIYIQDSSSLNFSFHTYNDDNAYIQDSVTAKFEDGKFINENSFFDEETKFEMTYDDDEVTIKASDDEDTDSILNQVDGVYTKINEDDEDYGWTGIYTLDDATISISQLSSNNLSILIEKESSILQNSADDFTDSEINYSSEVFDDTENLNIQKTDDGIKVEASSTDSDSLLNEITGEYKKEK